MTPFCPSGGENGYLHLLPFILTMFMTRGKDGCIKGGDENKMEFPLQLTAGHLPHNEEMILSNARLCCRMMVLRPWLNVCGKPQ